MIGRKSSRNIPEDEVVERRSFDDFELRLGDIMRGERATMGKSLLDVQRELRIKASYIAAIENADPSAFDTPGFIAGYVRSYARYLNMDPDKAFRTFCEESGFAPAHGMSSEASVVKKSDGETLVPPLERDPFAQPSTPYLPQGEAFLSRIEPSAVGSSLVLVALIAALGFGGWTVLNEVQRVQMAPVDQTPVVLSELDPLQGAVAVPEDAGDAMAGSTAPGAFTPPSEGIDRLYRPQALDVPVLVARDAPISTLDPTTMGAFLPDRPVPAPRDQSRMAMADEAETPGTPGTVVPQVVEDPAPELQMVAVRPAWVRVRAADGTAIFEGIMNAGDTYSVPATEEPPTLRVGESGAVYFVVNGLHYGPAGPSGTVTSNVALSIENLTTAYAEADPSLDRDLARMVAEAGALPVDAEN